MVRPYREDIDWLRALAVISVLGYHWDIPPFRGGYVGVDIFFVISGFLITQIIQADAREGAFSFANFYERRIRRLLPALYAMAVLACLPAFYFFLASERTELFKSVIATITFTSNIYFWRQSGYFDHAAEEYPLLHTWSLSVEEQFYLVLPVLIWFLCRQQKEMTQRRTRLLIGLGALALVSFAASHWLMKTQHIDSAFYLSPPRAWEFLVGSLIAIEGVPVPRNIHVKRIARLLGIILILIAVIGYRSSTSFPGAAALLPCLGAAAFIWSGMESGTVARAVWSPLNVASFIGKISYSLYLWHWPLILYLRFSKPDLTVSAGEKGVLFAAAMALAYGSYRFVEQPFRRRRLIPRQKTVFAVAGISTAVLLLASVVGLIDSARPRAGSSSPLQAYNKFVFPDVYRNGVCLVGPWAEFDRKTCLTPAADKINVLVWGDSIAAGYTHGIRLGLDPARINVMQLTVGKCFPTLSTLLEMKPACSDMLRNADAFFRDSPPDLIIMAGSWSAYSGSGGSRIASAIADVQRTISILKERRIPVLLVGPPIEYRRWLPSMLLRAQANNIELTQEQLIMPTLFGLSDRLKAEFPSQDGMRFVSLTDAICPQRQCPTQLDNGAPMTFDHIHPTVEGSVLAGRFITDAAKQMLPALK